MVAVRQSNRRTERSRRLAAHVSIASLDIAVRKNWESHIDASHSRQPLVKGERLVRYEVNAVILKTPCLLCVCRGQASLPVVRPHSPIHNSAGHRGARPLFHGTLADDSMFHLSHLAQCYTQTPSPVCIVGVDCPNALRRRPDDHTINTPRGNSKRPA